jgi:hypothetical protein
VGRCAAAAFSEYALMEATEAMRALAVSTRERSPLVPLVEDGKFWVQLVKSAKSRSSGAFDGRSTRGSTDPEARFQRIAAR